MSIACLFFDCYPAISCQKARDGVFMSGLGINTGLSRVSDRAGQRSCGSGSGDADATGFLSVGKALCSGPVWMRVILGIVLILAGAVGVHWRDSIWAYSAPARFTGDIANALHQGDQVLSDAGGTDASIGELMRAYRDRYERVAQATPDDSVADLDYPPLRLLIATLWSYQTRQALGGGGYTDQRAVFMLRINYACEIAAAVAMCLLVRLVMIRGGRSVRVSEIRAGVCLILFWLNPALIQNAHAWPQWDVWLMPFYLGACWCVLKRWGWLAGALLVTGGMLKGQLMMVAPVLLVWPWLTRDWRTGVGVAAGFLSAGALWVSPWMVRGWEAWGLVVAGTAMAGLTVWASPFMRPEKWEAPASVRGVMSFVRRVASLLTPVTSVAFAMMVCLAARYLGGSWTWLEVGFPTDKYKAMAVGPMHNLAGILEAQWGWELTAPVEVMGVAAPMRTWLIGLFGVLLAVGVIGLAWSSRRGSVHVLAGIVVPWLLMYTCLPQMHERYLVWAAALSAMLVAVRPAWVLMHVALTTQSVALMATTQLAGTGQEALLEPPLWGFLSKLGPWAGYATITMAVVLLVGSFPGGSTDSPRLGAKTGPNLPQ